MVGVDLVRKGGLRHARIDERSGEHDLVRHEIRCCDLPVDLCEVGNGVGRTETALDLREFQAGRCLSRLGRGSFGYGAADDPDGHSSNVIKNFVFDTPDITQEGESGQCSEKNRADQHDDLLISHNYLTCIGPFRPRIGRVVRMCA